MSYTLCDYSGQPVIHTHMSIVNHFVSLYVVFHLCAPLCTNAFTPTCLLCITLHPYVYTTLHQCLHSHVPIVYHFAPICVLRCVPLCTTVCTTLHHSVPQASRQDPGVCQSLCTTVCITLHHSVPQASQQGPGVCQCGVIARCHRCGAWQS